MAWCPQAPSHYLSQCWPRSVSPYSYHSFHGMTAYINQEGDSYSKTNLQGVRLRETDMEWGYSIFQNRGWPCLGASCLILFSSFFFWIFFYLICENFPERSNITSQCVYIEYSARMLCNPITTSVATTEYSLSSSATSIIIIIRYQYHYHHPSLVYIGLSHWCR